MNHTFFKICTKRLFAVRSLSLKSNLIISAQLVPYGWFRSTGFTNNSRLSKKLEQVKPWLICRLSIFKALLFRKISFEHFLLPENEAQH